MRRPIFLLVTLIFSALSSACGDASEPCVECICESTAECGSDEVCLAGECVNNAEPQPGAGEVTCPIGEAAPNSLMDTCFASIQAGQLATNLRGYSPRFELYSDGAVKRRWIYLPPGSEVDASNVDDWQFPVGTILWKEFSLDTAERIETRMLEKLGPGSGTSAWRATVYLWTSDQADAHASTSGSSPDPSEDYLIDDLPTYPAPNTALCDGCHQSSHDMVLGFSALQLSDEAKTGSHSAWVDSGHLVGQDVPTQMVGSQPTQDVLGYLHSNCGTCHSAAGSMAGLGMRLDYDIATSPDPLSTNVFTTAVYNNLRITPGSTEGSNAFLRFSDGSMPPSSASNVVNSEFSQQFRSWLFLIEGSTALPATVPLLLGANDVDGSLHLGYDETVIDSSEGEVFRRIGPMAVRSRAFFSVDSAATYTLSGRFRSNGIDLSEISLGFAPYTADGVFIQSLHSNRTGSAAVVDLGVTTLDTIETLSSVDSWNQTTAEAWHRHIGIYYDGDTSKMPDYVLVGTGGSSTDPDDGAYKSAVGTTVRLNTPLPQQVLDAMTTSTVLMNHVSAEAFLWSSAWNVEVSDQWVDFTGTISGNAFNGGVGSWRPGTEFAKVMLVANNKGSPATSLLFDEISVTISP